jgi:sensor c-di-GMP phosphodiesterase-like protein
LDDFGSGYSSLSHLRRFPIDIVKIDKSFVDDVAGDGANSAIARSIIDLGRAMQIQTVAEGIEADEQAEVLRTLGCELGQGFFFARPLKAEDWDDLLQANTPGDGGGKAAGNGGGENGEDPARTKGPGGQIGAHRRAPAKSRGRAAA